MTDNRTTELQSLSKLKKAGKLRYWRGTIEVSESELHAICDEIQAEHDQAIAATLGRQKAKSHPFGYERDTGCYDCTRCECGCINDISSKYCNDCGGEIEIDESAEKEYYDGYSKHTVFAKKHDDGSLEFCERRYVPEDAATLGSDDEYEAKMDELLCRLTNGKWSKSRAYSLEFMVSCVDEEYEDAYEKERAELGNGTCEMYQYKNALGFIDEWQCSECGADVKGIADDTPPNFCPSCGKAVTR